MRLAFHQKCAMFVTLQNMRCSVVCVRVCMCACVYVWLCVFVCICAHSMRMCVNIWGMCVNIWGIRWKYETCIKYLLYSWASVRHLAVITLCVCVCCFRSPSREFINMLLAHSKWEKRFGACCPQLQMLCSSSCRGRKMKEGQKRRSRWTWRCWSKSERCPFRGRWM